MSRMIVRFARREPSVPIAIVFLFLIVLVWMTASNNLGIVALTNSISQKLPLVAVSIGAAIAILGKGIDLSVGATLTLVNVLLAFGGSDSGLPFALWIVLALLAAIGVGLVNGGLVAYLGLPPLIATLATQSIVFGIALYILPTPGGAVPRWFTGLTLTLIAGVPLVLLFLLMIPLLGWWPLRRTKFGTYLLAVGADPESAFTSGIPVKKTLVESYVLSALFAGLGGVLITMNAGSGDPLIGTPYTLNAIAAAVIGGVSLRGGRGTIVGAVVGALVISFINNFLFALGINTYWQYLVTGFILIVALAVPLMTSKLKARREAKL